MTKQNLSLRPAILEDAETLLKWRNDEATIKASHVDTKVELEQHIKWLETTLLNQNRQLYIAEKNGISIGTVRADYDNGIYELSWTVAQEARGQGIGKQMVNLLAKRIKEPIRVEIKKGNEASFKIANFLGMKLVKIDSTGVLHYQLAQKFN